MKVNRVIKKRLLRNHVTVSFFIDEAEKHLRGRVLESQREKNSMNHKSIQNKRADYPLLVGRGLSFLKQNLIIKTNVFIKSKKSKESKDVTLM